MRPRGRPAREQHQEGRQRRGRHAGPVAPPRPEPVREGPERPRLRRAPAREEGGRGRGDAPPDRREHERPREEGRDAAPLARPHVRRRRQGVPATRGRRGRARLPGEGLLRAPLHLRRLLLPAEGLRPRGRVPAPVGRAGQERDRPRDQLSRECRPAPTRPRPPARHPHPARERTPAGGHPRAARAGDGRPGAAGEERPAIARAVREGPEGRGTPEAPRDAGGARAGRPGPGRAAPAGPEPGEAGAGEAPADPRREEVQGAQRQDEAVPRPVVDRGGPGREARGDDEPVRVGPRPRAVLAGDAGGGRRRRRDLRRPEADRGVDRGADGGDGAAEGASGGGGGEERGRGGQAGVPGGAEAGGRRPGWLDPQYAEVGGRGVPGGGQGREAEREEGDRPESPRRATAGGGGRGGAGGRHVPRRQGGAGIGPDGGRRRQGRGPGLRGGVEVAEPREPGPAAPGSQRAAGRTAGPGRRSREHDGWAATRDAGMGRDGPATTGGQESRGPTADRSAAAPGRRWLWRRQHHRRDGRTDGVRDDRRHVRQPVRVAPEGVDQDGWERRSRARRRHAGVQRGPDPFCRRTSFLGEQQLHQWSVQAACPCPAIPGPRR